MRKDRRGHHWYVLAALCVACAPSFARAETRVIESLEWRVADSDAVLVGRFAGSQDARPPSHGRWIQWDVDQVIKGSPDLAGRRIRTWAEPGAVLLSVQGQRARPALLFFTRATRRPDLARELGWDGLVIHRPATPLDAKPEVPLADGSVPDDARLLVEIARREVARPQRDPVGVWLEADWGSQAIKRFFRSSAVCLVVPADERWRAEIRRRVTAGQQVFWNFRSTDPSRLATPQNVELMRWMMLSPTWRVVGGYAWPQRLDRFREKDFFHRRVACEILRSWGVDVKPPVLSEPLLMHRPASPWMWVAAVCVLALTAAAAWRVRMRVAVPAMLVLAVALGTMWWRSWRFYEDVLWARGGSEYELSSHTGAVRWLRVHDAAAPRPLEWASGRTDANRYEQSAPTHTNALASSATSGRWGFKIDRGLTIPDARSAVHSYLMIRVPYWALVGLAGAWPLGWSLARTHRTLRRHVRRRRGNCVQCGYDLRGAGATCPECGAVN
jgi:hypothetical protein